jgi:UTP-glucose-1-phosphate uridylyltransferase
MNPTLLILAAGMGRRYGGPKQIDRFGPSGETIMDYALYDALAAGFAKVVFVIRHDFESDFRAVVGGKYENRVSVDYVFQELDDLPPGFTVPSGRTKPWGTAHAIWCARRCVQEPFVSINADDYYGKSAFGAVAQHLMRPAVENPERLPEYCMVGYPVLQTLSEHGAVARAICEVDEEGFLKVLVERTHVERSGDTGRYVAEAGKVCVLQGDEVVSMNMWGFSPAVFDQLERHLTRFLEVQTRTRDNSECVIPVALNEILEEKAARVRVLPTSDAWFGVTHAKDRLGAIESIREMVKRGEYPSPIWSCG